MFELAFEKFKDPLMPVGEFGVDLGQKHANLGLRQCHDAGDNMPGPLCIAGIERPQENPGLVGFDNRFGTYEVDGFGAHAHGSNHRRLSFRISFRAELVP